MGHRCLIIKTSDNKKTFQSEGFFIMYSYSLVAIVIVEIEMWRSGLVVGRRRFCYDWRRSRCRGRLRFFGSGFLFGSFFGSGFLRSGFFRSGFFWSSFFGGRFFNSFFNSFFHRFLSGFDWRLRVDG